MFPVFDFENVDDQYLIMNGEQDAHFPSNPKRRRSDAWDRIPSIFLREK